MITVRTVVFPVAALASVRARPHPPASDAGNPLGTFSDWNVRAAYEGR